MGARERERERVQTASTHNTLAHSPTHSLGRCRWRANGGTVTEGGGEQRERRLRMDGEKNDHSTHPYEEEEEDDGLTYDATTPPALALSTVAIRVAASAAEDQSVIQSFSQSAAVAARTHA